MEPKSIVFLIDGSGSIFGEARRLLKETAKSVLHSLVSDLDYIDIAVFRDNTTYVEWCYHGYWASNHGYWASCHGYWASCHGNY